MRVVVFDFDDTLIYSRSNRMDLLVQAIMLFDHPVDADAIEANWGRPFRELLIAGSPTLELCYEDFIKHYTKILRANRPLACPGVLEGIPHLALKTRLVVHSSSHSALVRTDLDTLGLLSHFDFICGSDWYSTGKPDPASLEPIRRLFGAEPNWTGFVYVGDSSIDHDLCRAANLQFVRVCYEGEYAPFAGRADEVITSVAQLASILDVLRS